MGSRSGRGLGGLLRLVAVGAMAAGAVGLVRSRRPRWATGEDPHGPEGLTLPPGQPLTVTTDDGAELDVLVAGPADGPLVVLAHCWTGNKSMWGPVARQLVAGGHRVVVYDQRGHGESTIGTDPMRMERLGEDLRAILVAVGANELVLAGHSMGGMTVQALAVAHPDLVARFVKGIVLVSTAAHIGFPYPLPDRLAGLILGDAASTRIAKRGLAATRGALGLEAHRAHVEATHDAFAGTAGAVRAGFLVGMSHMDFRGGLGSIAVPTTILVGSHDLLTPPRRARALAAKIPDAHLEVVEGPGHMLPLEAPDRVADAIAERARALRAATG